MKSTKEYLIGIDTGTSSIKGVLLSTEGDVLKTISVETSFLKGPDGLVEIVPEDYYLRVCSIIRSLGQAVDDPAHIKAVSFCAASGNAMLTDSSGEAICNIISWLDKRTEFNMPEILSNFSEMPVHDIVGWPFLKSFPLAAFSWWKENKTDLFKNAAHCCMDTDWLIYRLTGNWLMDYSTATTFYLQDQIKRKYCQDFLELLEIDEKRLSKLVPSGTVAGKITAEGADDCGLSAQTLVVCGSFDHPSAARGTGVFAPGDLLLSCGTSWVGFYPVEDRCKALDDDILIDPFLSHRGGPWGAIFFIPQIGLKIDWYIDNLICPSVTDKYKVFDSLAAQANEGADGLVIDMEEDAHNIDASPQNIARAVMEGVAELMNKKIQCHISADSKASRIVMVGGPTKSNVWPQILADKCSIELQLANGQFSGAVGAAFLAGVGAGVYRNEVEAISKLKVKWQKILPVRR